MNMSIRCQYQASYFVMQSPRHNLNQLQVNKLKCPPNCCTSLVVDLEFEDDYLLYMLSCLVASVIVLVCQCVKVIFTLDNAD